MLPHNQRNVIEQAKFVYSPLEKAFEKQKRTTDQDKKQIKAIEDYWKLMLNLMNLLKRILISKEMV